MKKKLLLNIITSMFVAHSTHGMEVSSQSFEHEKTLDSAPMPQSSSPSNTGPTYEQTYKKFINASEQRLSMLGQQWQLDPNNQYIQKEILELSVLLREIDCVWKELLQVQENKKIFSAKTQKIFELKKNIAYNPCNEEDRGAMESKIRQLQDELDAFQKYVEKKIRKYHHP